MYARLNCVLPAREPAHIAFVGFKLISHHVPAKRTTRTISYQLRWHRDNCFAAEFTDDLVTTCAPVVVMSRSSSRYKTCLGPDELRSNWLVSPLVFRLLDNFPHSFH